MKSTSVLERLIFKWRGHKRTRADDYAVTLFTASSRGSNSCRGEYLRSMRLDPPTDPIRSLIRDGAAFPFTAHAAAPTVTMPRVKALTTGSVPSFADLILNLDESDTSSSLAHQDTWLAQIRQHLHSTGSGSFGNGSIAFYGDDTWLKLFPDFFTIHDGTSSFFVSVSTSLPIFPSSAALARLSLPEKNSTWPAL